MEPLVDCKLSFSEFCFCRFLGAHYASFIFCQPQTNIMFLDLNIHVASKYDNLCSAFLFY